MSRGAEPGETDERDRLKRLLVIRDGFLTAMLLVVALAVLPAFFDEEQVDAAAPRLVAFFPLAPPRRRERMQVPLFVCSQQSKLNIILLG